MSTKSKIEWTEVTWNPTRGCSRVSPGCEHCYAERIAHRFSGKGQAYEGLTVLRGSGPRWTGRVEVSAETIEQPLAWKKPRLVFVNSMSDIFHEAIDEADIRRIFAVMEGASQHTFQVLTKRSHRLKVLSSSLPWPSNVWMGVSVESQGYVSRIDDLVETPAHVKFVSAEPLIDALSIPNISQLDWLIVGGESGPGARPMEEGWVKSLREQCVAANVSFFFKQWGGVDKSVTGRLLDGRTWDEMPTPSSSAQQGKLF